MVQSNNKKNSASLVLINFQDYTDLLDVRIAQTKLRMYHSKEMCNSILPYTVLYHPPLQKKITQYNYIL